MLQPALVSKQDYVKEKVALLALMVLVFQRPPHERNIPFLEIAETTRLPVEQVEWLVMRALSCKLIKGSIDQVDGIVRVTWVQVSSLDVVAKPTLPFDTQSCRLCVRDNSHACWTTRSSRSS